VRPLLLSACFVGGDPVRLHPAVVGAGGLAALFGLPRDQCRHAGRLELWLCRGLARVVRCTFACHGFLGLPCNGAQLVGAGAVFRFSNTTTNSCAGSYSDTMQLVSSSPSSSICSWEKYPKGWPAPGIAWLVVSTASGRHDLPNDLPGIERGVYYSTKPVKAKTATRGLGSPPTSVLSPYSLHGAAALPGRSTGRTVVGRRIRRRAGGHPATPGRDW